MVERSDRPTTWMPASDLHRVPARLMTCTYAARVRSPPDDLDVASLALVITEAWQSPVADLRYAPVGFGSHHWVATDASGARRFVTVDDLDQHGADGASEGLARLQRALLTAHALWEVAGLSFVVAPLLAVDGTLLRAVEPRYAAAMFPFVDGQPYPQGEHSTSQDRAAVVEVLTQLHEATLTARAFAGVEDLELTGRGDLERALGRLQVPWSGGPYAEATRGLLTSSAANLRVLLAEYDRLANLARTSNVPWVITHGEPKADNFLATDAGPVLVDWDTALIAPAARDLWMVDEGVGEGTAYYTELTGRHVSQPELTLYRLRWDLADIAAYVQWFTAPHARSADSEVAWNALSQTLHLKEHWPQLL